MRKPSVLLWLKGIVIGAAMLLPGLSGGTTAILLGIYDSMVSAVSSFRKAPKKNLIYLATVALGGGVGILLFAKPLLFLTEQWEFPMTYLFMGAVLGGIPILWREGGIQRFSLSCVLYPLLGAALVVTIGYLPQDLFQMDGTLAVVNILLLLAAGIVLAVALVLPGISFSYLLLILGLYRPALAAVESLNFGFLLPLGMGVLAGVLLTTRLLERCMARHPQGTYLVILGFVIGSLKDVFPGVPAGWELLICPLTLAAGFFGVFFATRRGGRALS